MTTRDFKILQALETESYDNSQYTFESDIKSTQAYFGTVKDTSLTGPWLCIWSDTTDPDNAPILRYSGSRDNSIIPPDMVLEVRKDNPDDPTWYLFCYRFDNKEFD